MGRRYCFATLDLSLSNFVLKDRENQKSNCFNQGWVAAPTNIPQTSQAHYNRSLFLVHEKLNVGVSSQLALLDWAVSQDSGSF